MIFWNRQKTEVIARDQVGIRIICKRDRRIWGGDTIYLDFDGGYMLITHRTVHEKQGNLLNVIMLSAPG